MTTLYLSLRSLGDFFVFLRFRLFFYRKEHEADAKSTKTYTQFIQGLYIRTVIKINNYPCTQTKIKTIILKYRFSLLIIIHWHNQIHPE